MQSVLAGGAVGVIGLLAGAVIALWWKSKFHDAKTKVVELTLKYKQEVEDHDETLQRAQADAEKYEDTIEGKDERIAHWKTRAEELQKKRLASATGDQLRDIANELFPAVSEEDEGRHEVENKDSDDAGTVSEGKRPTEGAVAGEVLKVRGGRVLSDEGEPR